MAHDTAKSSPFFTHLITFFMYKSQNLICNKMISYLKKNTNFFNLQHMWFPASKKHRNCFSKYFQNNNHRVPNGTSTQSHPFFHFHHILEIEKWEMEHYFLCRKYRPKNIQNLFEHFSLCTNRKICNKMISCYKKNTKIFKIY